MKRGKVTRPGRDKGRIQVQRGNFVADVSDLQPYGLQRHLPENAKVIFLAPDGEPVRAAILGYVNDAALDLKQGEVALYSEHGQQIYCKDDGTLHIEAAGLLSLHSDEEDLYSLLKDLLDAVKGLQTAQIDTQVNGGLVTLAPTGTAPIANASGINPGVGLSAGSTQKLDKLAERLDKLLQQGEKAETEESQ